MLLNAGSNVDNAGMVRACELLRLALVRERVLFCKISVLSIWTGTWFDLIIIAFCSCGYTNVIVIGTHLLRFNSSIECPHPITFDSLV